LYRGEGVYYLHQATEQDLFGEEPRCSGYDREDDGDLTVSGREPGKLFLAFHDIPEIREYVFKPFIEDAELSGFAFVEGDTLSVLAYPHQTETEIGFETLLGEIQAD
jgi:hypothetical protein